MAEDTIVRALREQIKAVHTSRLRADNDSAFVAESRQLWENRNTDIIGKAVQSRQELVAAEAKLRELTLEAYAADPSNKAPATGVGIRVMDKMGYAPDKAFAWAQEHKIALQLDKRAFETIAKSTPLDFVIIVPEPQATIAQDLTAALAEIGG